MTTKFDLPLIEGSEPNIQIYKEFHEIIKNYVNFMDSQKNFVKNQAEDIFNRIWKENANLRNFSNETLMDIREKRLKRLSKYSMLGRVHYLATVFDHKRQNYDTGYNYVDSTSLCKTLQNSFFQLQDEYFKELSIAKGFNLHQQTKSDEFGDFEQTIRCLYNQNTLIVIDENHHNYAFCLYILDGNELTKGQTVSLIRIDKFYATGQTFYDVYFENPNRCVSFDAESIIEINFPLNYT